MQILHGMTLAWNALQFMRSIFSGSPLGFSRVGVVFWQILQTAAAGRYPHTVDYRNTFYQERFIRG